MKTVRMLGTSYNGQPIEIGTIGWDGSDWKLTGNKKAMRRILDHSIIIKEKEGDDPRVVSSDEPDLFLEHLQCQYHSCYMHATKPTESTALSTDAQGHEHKGKGKGGGQFTSTGGGSDSSNKPEYTTMADSAVNDPEIVSKATTMGGDLKDPADYPPSYYRQFPVLYRGSKEGPASGHYIYVTPDKALADMHIGEGGQVEEFRLLPGAKVFPDPEVWEEMEEEHGGVSGYNSLFKARTAIVHTSHLGPKKQPKKQSRPAP